MRHDTVFSLTLRLINCRNTTPAAIACSTRRLPALMSRSPSLPRTTGGWMMPIARMEARSCVHLGRGGRAARIFRVGHEGTRIDAAKFGHSWLLRLVSSVFYFRQTGPSRRIDGRDAAL